MTQTNRVIVLFSFAAWMVMASMGAAANKDYTRQECPVIGNVDSKIYHTPASDSYRKLLKGNQDRGDNRICFRTEREARDAGYRKSRK